MQYPILSNSAKAINIASLESYSSLYDIVWSFDYAISGNTSTEAGFTVFLATTGSYLTGGNTGIDLGYSGLNLSTSTAVKSGFSQGSMGVGFDTTGLFAASAYVIDGVNTVVRDGINLPLVKKNSITIRGSQSSNFSIGTSVFHESISSFNTNFKIVENGITFKTIRARLGNVGKTIYIDFRNSPTEEFQRLIEYNVTQYLPVSAFYHVGVSFATSISSAAVNTIGNVYLKNFHVEGAKQPSLLTTQPSISTAIQTLPLNETILIPGITAVPEVFSLQESYVAIPPVITNQFPTRTTGSSDAYVTMGIVGGGVAGINSSSTDVCSNIATLNDLYNFGYKVKINELNVTLERINTYSYASSLSSYTLVLQNFNTGWVLTNTISASTYQNNNIIPIGVYTGPQTYNIVYTNE